MPQVPKAKNQVVQIRKFMRPAKMNNNSKMVYYTCSFQIKPDIEQTHVKITTPQ